MSSFPKINLELEDLFLQFFELLDDHSEFESNDRHSVSIDQLLELNLIQKSKNLNHFSFTEHGLEFIKVLQNKQRRSTILKKMTLEDYILAIHYLNLINKSDKSNIDNIVSMTDLARYLGLSNSSISEYIRSIEKEGFLVVIPRKGVKLTNSGEERVLRLIEKRDFLIEFLNKVLKIDRDLSEVESHVLEHNVSPIVFERLKLLVGQLKKSDFSLKLNK